MTKDASKDRSKEALAMQGEILKEVREILIKNNIKPVLSDGPVLGYVREGDFIKWDFDADFFVNSELMIGKEDQLAEDFKNHGFIDIKKRPGLKDWKVCCEKNDFHIDIRGFFIDGDNHKSVVKRSDNPSDKRYSVYSMPRKFMDNLQEIEFYGAKYFIPADTDGYLTHLYGDWRIPIRSCKHSEYLNPDFKTEILK